MRAARRIREGRGLSQPEVMRRTGIDHSHLSKFERGEADLSLSNLQKIAALYGCTLNDLVADVSDELLSPGTAKPESMAAGADVADAGDGLPAAAVPRA